MEDSKADGIMTVTRGDTTPEDGEESGLLFCQDPLRKSNPRCHENVVNPSKGSGPQD